MAWRILFNLLRWIFLAFGAGLIILGLNLAQLWLEILFLAAGILLISLGLIMVGWYLRPNRAQVNPVMQIESWDVVNDEQHNSNTDLIQCGDYFYLVHAVSPFHFANNNCQLELHRSQDGRAWETLAHFSSQGEDIRDPKLAVIHDQLYLYALVNRSFDPEPYTTVYTYSQDGGVTWSPLARLEPEGWLFWKPKTNDGLTWHVAAYWHEHGKSALFSSTDGVQWQFISMIYDLGHRNDETDIEFMPDGSILATARLEGDFREGGYGMFFGHPAGGTLIASALSRYTNFEPLTISLLTRLDGPALFSHAGRVFAVGRMQAELSQPFKRQGSIFARKRTAIFEVKTDRLVWLSDVPSAGDTAYAGVALHNGFLYFSYYTSPIRQDYPWIVGMFNPTAIRIARVALNRLVV